MSNDKRASEREACLIEAAIRLETKAHPIDCVIENISETGAKVRFSQDSRLPSAFVLMVPVVADHYEEKSVELRWQIGNAAGVKFCKADC